MVRTPMCPRPRRAEVTAMQRTRANIARSQFEVCTWNTTAGTTIAIPVRKPRKSVARRRRKAKEANPPPHHMEKGDGKDNGSKTDAGGKPWKKTKQRPGIKSLESQAWPEEHASIKSLQAAGSFIFALGEPDETSTVRLTRASYGSQSSGSEHARGSLRIA